MTDIENKESEKPAYKVKFLSSDWYDKNYKKLLVVEIILIILALAYLVYFYNVNGDIMFKDTSLTGGTVITVYGENISSEKLTDFLNGKLSDFNTRILEDTYTRKQIAISLETKEDVEKVKPIIEDFLGYSLNNDNSSIEITGSSLSESFYKELIFALGLAFLFMAIVVFLIFKKFIPSLAVIHAAIADIIFALALANLFGFELSTAGIAALLMLIGYSVDTDILLTTRVLKRQGEGTVNSRIKSSFKTGVMMSLTALCAVTLGFFISQAQTLRQIFFIMAAGIFFDIISTWLGNASMIKWYCEKKKIN